MLIELNDFIQRVADYRVLVIGETIQDEFVPVTYEGHSMKSNCPVISLQGRKTIQEGGAAAIANHLRDFVKHVDVITNPAGSIVKTRYVDTDDKRKHIEINKFSHHEYGNIEFSARDYDIVIVADFGHGFCDSLNASGEFCFMAQTNSNNFGFNRTSKWKNYKKKMICMDLREASLQMNLRMKTMDDEKLIQLYHYELNTGLLYVTLGGKGSVCTNGKDIWRQPVFKSNIVDTIGAGDTFYAFACLISEFEDAGKYQFVPGLAASLSTTWLCNEKSISKENLLKHAAQFV